MVAYTPKYQIPYPENTDPVGAAVFRQMAERVEQTLTNAQMPKAEQNLQLVGPYVPSAFNERQNVTTTKLELCSVTIPDPGWRYRILPIGRWQTWAGGAGTRPDIEVRIGSTTGQQIGFGLGSTAVAANQIVPIAVLPDPASALGQTPANAPSWTGSQVVRFYAMRGTGSSAANFSNDRASAHLWIVRA